MLGERPCLGEAGGELPAEDRKHADDDVLEDQRHGHEQLRPGIEQADFRLARQLRKQHGDMAGCS